MVVVVVRAVHGWTVEQRCCSACQLSASNRNDFSLHSWQDAQLSQRDRAAGCVI